jgi:MOSC domain-containing protein YiiM
MKGDDQTGMSTEARVASVHLSPVHGFSKQPQAGITLLAGLGVKGDAHAGETVRHRSRVAVDPNQPNLRQLHLLAGELLDELAAAGFDVPAGGLGENITTMGLDGLALPRGTKLQIGPVALVEVTGLRNPCAQIETFRPGLLARVLGRDAEGRLVKRAGIMAIVLAGGRVAPGDPIRIVLPDPPHIPLDRV